MWWFGRGFRSRPFSLTKRSNYSSLTEFCYFIRFDCVVRLIHSYFPERNAQHRRGSLFCKTNYWNSDIIRPNIQCENGWTERIWHVYPVWKTDYHKTSECDQNYSNRTELNSLIYAVLLIFNSMRFIGILALVNKWSTYRLYTLVKWKRH